MVKRMVESTSSSSSVHRLIGDNNNHYKSMVMDVMRMNQVYAGECSIVDEKPNINATRFFDLLKDTNKSLYRMDAQITVNYQSLHSCSQSSQIMGE
jgi:hypothetical protein